MSTARPRAARLACGLAFVAILLTTGRVSAGSYDPALSFKSHRTPHFVIHFHQGEEAMAFRLAGIAEAVRARLSAAMGRKGPTAHVVLVDQTDESNGLATVVPWNAIVIYAVPPSGADTIGNSDDWLEYVFTHEYAHVLHLDRSRGWARLARGIFGRSPIAFPNLSLPLWQIEGLATFHEGHATRGRLHAGDFRAVVDSAAAAGTMEPIDRVGGGLVDWPTGQGWYAYGARFHEYLARTYGPDTLNALADRTAGRFPYLTSGAFRAVYGKSLGSLWNEFRRDVESAHTAAPPAQAARQLTRLGYLVDTPREGPDGSIYFSATDAHRFPAVFRLAPTGSSEVVTRYGGTGLSIGRDWLVFDQLEFVRGVSLQGDLYLYSPETQHTRRLTVAARLADPDVSPDGRRLVAVQHGDGERRLVLLDAPSLVSASKPRRRAALSPLASSPPSAGMTMASPRWSPDGTHIAVERRLLQSGAAIAILDGETLREVAAIRAPEGGRVADPAWTPDGATLLFAAADVDTPFDVRAVDLGPGGRVTSPRRVFALPGGARAPLATRDGRLIVVGYTTDGHDLFEIPAGQWARDGGEPAPVAPAQAQAEDKSTAASVVGDASPYRPWPTVAPRAWEPVVESRDNRLRLGASTYGVDVLERHVVSATATWAVTTNDDYAGLAPASRPDWSASYAYQRWQPTFYAMATDRTSLFDVVGANGVRLPVAQREQTIDVGVWRAFRRVRWAHTVLAAYHVEEYTTTTSALTSDLQRAGVRTGWTFSSAKRYGHSISVESGVTMAATAELFRPGLGADGSAEAYTADMRAYVPLWLRHAVLAARAAVAHSSGDRAVRRRFQLGGTDSNEVAGAFGNDPVSLLRGFQDEVFVGDSVALSNLEARVPLASIQRGWGTWPFFVRTVHAAGFVDIGHAWSNAARWADRKIGYGAEVSTDVVFGYGLPLTLTGGVAWGDDGAGLAPSTREVYFRVGRSF
jgi:hypothetical protein